MSDLTYVLSLGGVAMLVVFELRRLGEPAASLWGWAWLALYASGLLSEVDGAPAAVQAMGLALGTQFSVLLVAGALASAGLARPPWLFAAGAGVALAAAAGQLLVGARLAQAVALFAQAPFYLGAALVAWRAGRSESATASERLLAPALLGMAAVGGTDSLVRIVGGPTTLVLGAWIGMSLLVAGLQMATIVGRVRLRTEQLLADRDRLARLVERTSDAAARCDPDGRIVYMNEAGRRMFGLPIGTRIEGVSLHDLYPAGSRDEIARDLEARLASHGGVASRDLVLQRLDGTPLDVSQVVIREQDAAGRTTGYGTLIRDESQRASIEDKTRRHARDMDLLRRIAEAGLTGDPTATVAEHALAHVRDLLDFELAGLYLLDDDGSVLRLVASFGMGSPPVEDLAIVHVDRPIPRLVLAGDEPLLMDSVATDPRVANAAVRESGIVTSAGVPLRSQGRLLGMAFFGWRTPRPWKDSDRPLLRVVARQIALALDHTRGLEVRRRQAEELDAERRTMRAVLENAPLGIMVSDAADRVAVMNRTCAAHFGLGDPEPWIGTSVAEMTSTVLPRVHPVPIDERRYAPLHADAGYELRDVEITLKDEEPRLLQLFSSPIRGESGEPAGRIQISRDITDERHLEEQLLQAQKMETVGRFAGGIAHDFNNQLTVILGNAKTVEQALRGGDPSRAALADLVRAADHCANLAQGLLSFARRRPVSLQTVSAARVLGEIEPMLRAMLPSRIHLSVGIEDGVPAVLADATQIQQALLNLALNARDAIEGAGRIDLMARRGAPMGSARGQDGDWVSIVVRDSGGGMDPAVRDRIFEPFFTTKDVGEGTGLGLSVAYGVVEAHGGWIEVESQPDHGSTFLIVLPAAQKPVSVSDVSLSPSPVPRGHELVLIADDEPAIRRLARRRLESLGYRVLEAGDGHEAVSLHAEQGGEIDLVVLDETMPGRTGLEALAAMRAREPRLRAILMSGSFEACDESDRLRGAAVLAKPYAPDALARLVRAVLDRPSEPTSS